MEELKGVLGVTLSISYWDGSITDRAVSEEVRRTKEARGNVGKFVKNLFPRKRGELDRVISLSGELRNAHYAMTRTWERGEQLLPTALYMDYRKSVGEVKSALETAYEALWEAYPEMVVEGHRDLGLLDTTPYPSLEEFKTKFGVKISMRPIPLTSDFRLHMRDEEMKEEVERLSEELASSYQSRLRDGTRELGERILAQARAAVENLTKDGGRFHTSWHKNLSEILAVLPKLDLTGELTQVKEEAEKLLKVEPEVLKKDKEQRRDLGKEAEEILKKMEGFF